MQFAPINHPVPISLKEFILSGQFDCLKIGVEREWVAHNFPEPDDIMGDNYDTAAIWRYGNIELHFMDDRLWLIYSDYIDTLDGGSKLTLDKWVLSDPQNLNLENISQALWREKASYSLNFKHDLEQIYMDIDISQVRLTFSYDEVADIQKAPLGAIHIGGQGKTSNQCLRFDENA